MRGESRFVVPQRPCNMNAPTVQFAYETLWNRRPSAARRQCSQMASGPDDSARHLQSLRTLFIITGCQRASTQVLRFEPRGGTGPGP